MKAEFKERARDVMRMELANAAFDIVVEKGYEQTADDIADALGISRATLFRYLGSKDEIVIAAMLGPKDQFATAYKQARHDPAASVWQRLRAAFEPVVGMVETSPERMRARFRLVQSLPALGASLKRARLPQIELLTTALTAEGREPFAAHVFSTAGVAVFDQCWALWANDETQSIREIADRAFRHLDAASLI